MWFRLEKILNLLRTLKTLRKKNLSCWTLQPDLTSFRSALVFSFKRNLLNLYPSKLLNPIKFFTFILYQRLQKSYKKAIKFYKSTFFSTHILFLTSWHTNCLPCSGITNLSLRMVSPILSKITNTKEKLVCRLDENSASLSAFRSALRGRFVRAGFRFFINSLLNFSLGSYKSFPCISKRRTLLTYTIPR